MLLIDEIDRADEEFEGYLLELLADFQITIPELGTIRADAPPVVIITSNRTREVHDALKRRCVYCVDRLPGLREGTPDRQRESARDHRAVGRPGHRLRPGAADRRPLQIRWCLGNARLGDGARGPESRSR